MFFADTQNTGMVSPLATGAQTRTDLIRGEFHGLEEFLHEFIGTFGSLLHKFGTQGFRLVRICGGDVLLLVLGVVEFHRNDIYEALETRAGRNRELAEDGLLAKFLVQGGTHTFPVGFFVIHLVHGDDHRNAILVCITGEQGGSHLDAGGAVHHHHGRFDHLEGTQGTSGEIVGTRRVDDVDLGAVQLCIERSGVDGFLVGLLELGVIGDGVLVFYATAAVDDLPFKKHGFGQRGLTGLGATDEHHVSDVFG